MLCLGIEFELLVFVGLFVVGYQFLGVGEDVFVDLECFVWIEVDDFFDCGYFVVVQCCVVCFVGVYQVWCWIVDDGVQCDE